MRNNCLSPSFGTMNEITNIMNYSMKMNFTRRRANTSIIPDHCPKNLPEIQGYCWPRLLIDDRKKNVVENKVEKKVIKALRRRKRDRYLSKVTHQVLKDYSDPPCLVAEGEHKVTVSSITGRPVTAEKQVMFSRMIPEKRRAVIVVVSESEKNKRHSRRRSHSSLSAKDC